MSKLETLVAASCIILVFGACGSRKVSPHSPLDSTPRPLSADDLGECSAANVVIEHDGSVPRMTRSEAEAMVAVGVESPASRAIYGLVSLGTNSIAEPKGENILSDGTGKPIVRRPAWIFVFRNQSIQRPGGGPAPRTEAERAARSSPLPPITSLGAVVDDVDRKFLYGWSCNL